MPKLRLKSRSSPSLWAHGCLLTLPIRSIILHFPFPAAPSEREDLVSHGPNFCCLQPRQYQPVFVPNWKWSVCDCRSFFLCTVRHGHVKQTKVPEKVIPLSKLHLRLNWVTIFCWDLSYRLWDSGVPQGYFDATQLFDLVVPIIIPSQFTGESNEILHWCLLIILRFGERLISYF